MRRYLATAQTVLQNSPLLLVGLAMAAVVFGTTAGSAQTRVWSAGGGQGNGSAATDCTDCGDDIGMMLTCPGGGRAAEVTVHWAATENGVEGQQLPVVFRIDRQVFRFTATTKNYGQIGYTPEFSLSPNDPLVEGLQGGQNAIITFQGQNTTISLKGSRGALDIFRAECGWNNFGQQQPQQNNAGGQVNAQPQALTVVRQADPQPAQDVTVNLYNQRNAKVDYYYIDQNGAPQYLFSLSPGQSVAQPSRPGLELAFGVDGQEFATYLTTSASLQEFYLNEPGAAARPGGGGQVVSAPTRPQNQAEQNNAMWKYYPNNRGPGEERTTHTLVYGVPETDDSIVMATCTSTFGRPPDLRVEFMAGPALAANSAATVTIASNDGTQTANGLATQQGRVVAVARNSGQQIQNWWNTFLAPGMISLMVNGEAAGIVDSMGQSTEAGAFYTACKMR